MGNPEAPTPCNAGIEKDWDDLLLAPPNCAIPGDPKCADSPTGGETHALGCTFERGAGVESPGAPTPRRFAPGRENEKGRNTLLALARSAIPEDPGVEVPPEKEGTDGPGCEPADGTKVEGPEVSTPCAFPPI